MSLVVSMACCEFNLCLRKALCNIVLQLHCTNNAFQTRQRTFYRQEIVLVYIVERDVTVTKNNYKKTNLLFAQTTVK